ncbi:cbb3-type cytochrome c oxidase subunit I [Vibrio chagasii]|nr:cbb3-type cytochrome c oxidase subunit I [Vibrio chagasii]
MVGHSTHRLQRRSRYTALFVFSVHIMGISSIMGAINVIVTIVNMRAPGMTWFKLPMFV